MFWYSGMMPMIWTFPISPVIEQHNTTMTLSLDFLLPPFRSPLTVKVASSSARKYKLTWNCAFPIIFAMSSAFSLTKGQLREKSLSPIAPELSPLLDPSQNPLHLPFATSTGLDFDSPFQDLDQCRSWDVQFLCFISFCHLWKLIMVVQKALLFRQAKSFSHLLCGLCHDGKKEW